MLAYYVLSRDAKGTLLLLEGRVQFILSTPCAMLAPRSDLACGSLLLVLARVFFTRAMERA
jgi:hypothetical protein